MVAQMPDRAAAISDLEKSTMAAASQLNFGDEGLRSKVIANAAIATLIDMGGSDVDPVLLRLSRQPCFSQFPHSLCGSFPASA